MKKRAMSMLLVLLMVVTLFPTFVPAAAAADEYGITNPAPAQDATGQMNLTKTLAPGENGTYDITMESWATGEVHAFTEKIPTDFVVVVDQSGSMAYKDMPVKYDNAGTVQLETIAAAAEPTPGTANANGYYYKAADGNYYRVYPVRDYLYEYVPGNTLYAYDTTPASARQWFGDSDDATFTAKNAIFCLDADGNFYQLYFDIHGGFLKYTVIPHYTRNDGTTKTFTPPEKPWFHQISNGNVIKPGDLGYRAVKWYWNDLFGGNDKYVFQELGGIRGGTIFDFPMYWRHIGYSQLAYRDTDGEVHIIPANDGTETTRFCNSSGEAVTTNGGSTKMMYDNLYTYDKPTNESRETALKKALTRFASAVAGETDSFGPVDNRVSIVGFSSPGMDNTEVLTNTDRDLPSTTNGWQKDTADANVTEYYGKALVGATTGTAGTVNSKITSAINAITSNGGTQPEDGLNMAYQILDNRGDKTTYTIRSGDKKDTVVKRNTVVIFFTDGQPGDYANSNQYKEANDVVAQAYNIKTLKDKDNKPLNTTIFSIGVFGESDGNPLTYEAHSTYSENEDYEFDLGYVKTVGSYSYLNRNWLQNNATHYGSKPNDTIFDYMSVVSSNYPAATQFMKIKTSNTAGEADTTGYADYLAMCAGVRGTSVQGNQFYRLASNQDTLIAAFLEAATMHSEESSTDVVLDDTAVLKDQVNLADFDATGASVSAKVCNMDGTEDSALTQLLTIDDSALATNGTATVTGFDYAEHYGLNGAGKKLVVTISGLTPAKATGTLKSNADTDKLNAAGVYGAGIDKPTVSITSPTLELSAATTTKHYTYVIDTNAKTRLATEANQLVAADNNANGVFDKSADKGPYDVTYQLNAGKQDGTMTTVNNNQEYRATINSAYTTVDTALVYGKPYDLTEKKFATDAAWTKITTVPASSVYYDDSFTEENAQVLNYPGDVVQKTGTFDGSNSHIFTFYGTGIDVYCTTHDNGGYVSAALYQGSSTTGTPYKTITVKNQSKGDYFNTPTVHFTDLEPAEYTVWLYANSGAQYKIDGVRVYNPVKATEDGETTEAAAELAKTDEANAHYFNLHDLLLNASSDYSAISKEQYASLEAADAVAVSGVLYLDNAANICLQSNDAQGKAQLIFNSDFNLYEKNSPINEIYLQTTNGQPQGVAFQLANYPVTGANEKVYLGVSAPKGSGKVLINGNELPVTSSVDQYYDITKWIATEGATKGVVSIKTSTDDANLISVTNLKITGVTAEAITGQNPPADAANNSNSLNSYRRLAFAPMTTATVEAIAEETVPELFTAEPENPGTPDTPDTPDQPDDPTPGGAGSVQEMLKQLFESLMKNLFGLFKGLGNW